MKYLKHLFVVTCMSTLALTACQQPAEQVKCPECNCEQQNQDADNTKQEPNTEPAEQAKQEKTVIPETNDMQEVLAFLKETKTYYIATVENDQPRVRPFGTANIFEGKLYFQTGKKKKVAHQIDANPKIEICAFDGQRWLRLSGEAVEDERIEAQKSMLDAYPQLQSMYQPGDGNNVVYYLKNATATISSFAAPERVITF